MMVIIFILNNFDANQQYLYGRENHVMDGLFQMLHEVFIGLNLLKLILQTQNLSSLLTKLVPCIFDCLF
jgi:hypothetical protein